MCSSSTRSSLAKVGGSNSDLTLIPTQLRTFQISISEDPNKDLQEIIRLARIAAKNARFEVLKIRDVDRKPDLAVVNIIFEGRTLGRGRMNLPDVGRGPEP